MWYKFSPNSHFATPLRFIYHLLWIWLIRWMTKIFIKKYMIYMCICLHIFHSLSIKYEYILFFSHLNQIVHNRDYIYDTPFSYGIAYDPTRWESLQFFQDFNENLFGLLTDRSLVHSVLYMIRRDSPVDLDLLIWSPLLSHHSSIPRCSCLSGHYCSIPGHGLRPAVGLV